MGDNVFDSNEKVDAISACHRCPRLDLGAVEEDRCSGVCPAVEGLADPGGEGGGDGDEALRRQVQGLLECRGFLWDVLMGGEWTGCARMRLAELSARYGAERVAQTFEEE